MNDRWRAERAGHRWLSRPRRRRPGSPRPERDVLLATKLHVPGPRPGFVPRPRLAERLDEGLARGLVLVCAPAGYGKTALLADWARRGERPVAWLSLDAGDNDPARFWRHAVAALDRVCPGIGERVGPLLGPPPPPSFEGLVTALINELAAQPGADEALLVLDDYHLIDAQPVHASLGFLLEHRPPGLHLVLASRADPPLALARLRARGQLAELRAAELRFTAERGGGAAARGAPGRWPCPMRRWRRWRRAPRAGRPGCSWPRCRCAGRPMWPGSWRRSPAATATSWTTWPRRCSSGRASRCAPSCWRPRCWSGCRGALCDAVTGRTGSQALLEQVERAGLFLVPLDEVRGWWRYHHLFADLLRARLQQEQPGRVRAAAPQRGGLV